MKLKFKVFLTILMVLSLMTSGMAFAATSLTKQGNPTSFDLNSIAEEKDSKLWIKVATAWDPKDSMYDVTSLPAGTKAIAVTFQITNFDQDKSLMYWCGSLTGNGKSSDIWDNSAPTDQMTIDSDGKYMFVFDAQKIFDGSLDSINSLQMVLPCKSVDDAAKTKMKFKCLDVVAITDDSELSQYKSEKIGEADSSTDSNTTKSDTKKVTLSVSKTSVTVAHGKSVTISYKATSEKDVTVISANKKIATVKKLAGKKIKISVPKTAKKGAKTTITLKSGSKKVTVKVLVK